MRRRACSISSPMPNTTPSYTGTHPFPHFKALNPKTNPSALDSETETLSDRLPTSAMACLQFAVTATPPPPLALAHLCDCLHKVVRPLQHATCRHGQLQQLTQLVGNNAVPGEGGRGGDRVLGGGRGDGYDWKAGVRGGNTMPPSHTQSCRAMSSLPPSSSER